MITGALLLAAGQSRRFGASDKLLAELNGAPLVSHAARALSLPMIPHRVAVVASGDVAAILRPLGFAIVMQPQGRPQSTSLSAGIAEMERLGVARAIVMLGDMPFIQTEDIARLLVFPADQPASAWAANAPMPPAIFPKSWFPRLAALTGDRGAGALLKDLPADARLTLPAERLRDIDRPEDLPTG
ncbi:nucleotidyltransferase family protein [Paracoccus sp. 11-3]|uniref:Nucleotidyltransferase family protein n=1 Tax=Paracoccus amoyensis TaxID=2760093 RepID=A0A926GEB9_9RHOB|nr:nucleotidyltransferase family protein [Paracoccus amoyensis]MBC9247605.1 nucleotidyltransferase family protein [Paracoccus amoyensis]